ncbi:hypothetical protein ABTX62_20435 [Streptomyces sp. NPDC096046]|uniref:hypothetical protein n=1 Tax=Streptomyces sp. NPDC096046 TaxID=3155542 RepID=UPI003333E896
MTARNNDDRRRAERDGGAEYDGMDALMAVLAGAPVPPAAREDAAYRAAHDAAAADVAQLRRQLELLGDMLARTGETEEAGAEAGGPAARAATAGPAGDALPARAATAGPAGDAPPAADTAGPGAVAGSSPRGASSERGGGDADGSSPVPAVAAGSGPGGAPAAAEPGAGGGVGAAPGVGGGATVTSLSSRRRARPKPLTVALKTLVAAAGATVVIGMGWLVVQSGGAGGEQDSGAAAAESAGRPQAGEETTLGHAGYLACARLVIEGTVAEVATVPGTGQDRVTVEVDRYYKPAQGQSRVSFPLDGDVAPRLRAGDRVLVGIPQGQAQPDLWVTGEKEIARDRAWITAGLPRSRTLPCP